MFRLILMLTLLSIGFVSKAQLVFPGGGSGSYTKTFPSGPYKIKNPDPKQNELHHYQKPCVDRFFNKAHPKVVSGFSKPIQTNDWWSAQIWDFETNKISLASDTSAYGTLMYFQPGWKIGPFGYASHPHPLSLKGRSYGLDISSNNSYYTSPDSKTAGFNNIMHLNISVQGLDVPGNVGTKVLDYGDWTVKLLWDDLAGHTLTVTSGHGLPYVYCQKSGGDVNLRYGGTMTVNWVTAQGLGVTINDGSTNIIAGTSNGQSPGPKNYGIFFPSGTTVMGVNAIGSVNPPSIFITKDEMEVILNPYTPANASRPALTLKLPSNKDYFSVAALPNNSLAAFNLFQKHAFAFVTDSKVTWNYNENSADVTSTLTLTTEAKEGVETQAIQALYRHQFLNSSNINTAYTYNSARGPMRVMTGNTFSTTMKHQGILPNLPWVGKYDSLYIYDSFNKMMAQTSLFWEDYYYGESYEHGKKLGRYADLIPLAKQVNHNTAHKALIDSVRKQLENWFTAGPVGVKNYKMFYYDQEWNTLAAYPVGYMAAGQLNDHHFHYGYFIKAAAMVARYVPGWAAQWGGMVETLIKDVNNWDRTDTNFPFLRFYDPYAGHSWASGHANFMDGNNQESATEAINFATAVALWGINTNNTTLRDLGIFLATNEIAATQQYWWNKDNASNPAFYTHKTSALIWGNKSEYRTWFPPGDPRHAHGINWLPFSGASLFLGYDTNLVASNYAEVTSNEPLMSTTPIANTPFMTVGKDWRDLGASYAALSNPSLAKSIETSLRTEPDIGWAGSTLPYGVFDGTSPQMTHHWIRSLDSLGRVGTIQADYVGTNVFIKGNCRHYVIYNPPGKPPRTVTFSDGRSFNVEADTVQVFYRCPDPLPLILNEFEVSKLGQTAELKWVTSLEENTKAFIIQRSSNGKNFTDIGNAAAKGNSTSIKHYSFIDIKPLPRLNYYRLKMVDLNGAFKFSDVKSLDFSGERLVYLYPNPASGIFYISGNDSGTYNIELYDVLGKMVLNSVGKTAINISELASGVYLANVLDENNIRLKSEKIQIY